MDIKVRAFPAVYLTATCPRHQCPVEIHIEESMRYKATVPTGAQIMMLRCKEGGMAGGPVDCSDDWELSILANGEIKIGP